MAYDATLMSVEEQENLLREYRRLIDDLVGDLGLFGPSVTDWEKMGALGAGIPEGMPEWMVRMALSMALVVLAEERAR